MFRLAKHGTVVGLLRFSPSFCLRNRANLAFKTTIIENRHLTLIGIPSKVEANNSLIFLPLQTYEKKFAEFPFLFIFIIPWWNHKQKVHLVKSTHIHTYFYSLRAWKLRLARRRLQSATTPAKTVFQPRNYRICNSLLQLAPSMLEHGCCNLAIICWQKSFFFSSWYHFSLLISICPPLTGYQLIAALNQ